MSGNLTVFEFCQLERGFLTGGIFKSSGSGQPILQSPTCLTRRDSVRPFGVSHCSLEKNRAPVARQLRQTRIDARVHWFLPQVHMSTGNRFRVRLRQPWCGRSRCLFSERPAVFIRRDLGPVLGVESTLGRRLSFFMSEHIADNVQATVRQRGQGLS